MFLSKTLFHYLPQCLHSFSPGKSIFITAADLRNEIVQVMDDTREVGNLFLGGRSSMIRKKYVLMKINFIISSRVFTRKLTVFVKVIVKIP